MDNLDQFDKSVIELIKTRRSYRSYANKDIDQEALNKFEVYLDQINNEAGSRARVIILSNEANGEKRKLGTYGFISGSKTFLIGILDRQTNDALQFGYLFEKVILKATELGLQTCWMGGTFKKKDFSQHIDMDSHEYIAIVSPIGYSSEQKRLVEKTIRSFSGSDKRKPWEELFFDEVFAPLTLDSAGEYALPLEMVRLGPSASNIQPWRIVKQGNDFHFYLVRKKGHSFAYDMQLNDIGIAKCHFQLTAAELGLPGEWQNKSPDIQANDLEYICSWVG